MSILVIQYLCYAIIYFVFSEFHIDIWRWADEDLVELVARFIVSILSSINLIWILFVWGSILTVSIVRFKLFNFLTWSLHIIFLLQSYSMWKVASHRFCRCFDFGPCKCHMSPLVIGLYAGIYGIALVALVLHQVYLARQSCACCRRSAPSSSSGPLSDETTSYNPLLSPADGGSNGPVLAWQATPMAQSPLDPAYRNNSTYTSPDLHSTAADNGQNVERNQTEANQTASPGTEGVEMTPLNSAEAKV